MESFEALRTRGVEWRAVDLNSVRWKEEGMEVARVKVDLAESKNRMMRGR